MSIKSAFAVLSLVLVAAACESATAPNTETNYVAPATPTENAPGVVHKASPTCEVLSGSGAKAVYRETGDCHTP